MPLNYLGVCMRIYLKVSFRPKHSEVEEPAFQLLQTHNIP